METIGKCKMKLQFSVLILVVSLSQLIVSSVALKFNMSGFEKCFLHLIDGRNNLKEGNDIFMDIIKDNPRMQHTVSTLNDILPDEYFFKEFCSVNIIVLLDAYYDQFEDPTHILGSRPLNPKNSVVFIVNKTNPWEYWKIKDDFFTYEYRVSIIVYLKDDLISIETAAAFLSAGASDIDLSSKPMEIKSNNSISLADVRKFNKIDWWKGPAILAGSSSYTGRGEYSTSETRSCAPMYTKTRHEDGVPEVGCSEELIFTENFARMYNLTTEYIPENALEFSDYYLRQKDYLGLVVFRSKARKWAWEIGKAGHTSYLNQYLVDTEVERFVYCTENVKRESFNFLIWLLPFDTPTWILIVICIMAFIILLKGNWVSAIFLFVFRQEAPGIVLNRYTIGFTLVSIILAYLYDCVISTHLTAPPPILIHDKLRELLDMGYKIVGYRNQSYEIDQKNQYNTSLESLFENERINISKILESGFIFDENWNDANISRFLSYCNATYSTPESSLIELFVLDYNPDVHCETLKTSKLIEPDIYAMSGWYIDELRRATQMFVESGILQRWRRYGKFVRSRFGEDLALKEKRDEEENNFKPFESGDWKVISMFLMFVVLACLALLVLLAEITLYQVKYRKPIRVSLTTGNRTVFAARSQPSFARLRARLHSPDVLIQTQQQAARVLTDLRFTEVQRRNANEHPVALVTTNATVHAARVASPILFVAPDGTLHLQPEDIRIIMGFTDAKEAVEISTFHADDNPKKCSEDLSQILIVSRDGTFHHEIEDIKKKASTEAENIQGKYFGQDGSHSLATKSPPPVLLVAQDVTVRHELKDRSTMDTTADTDNIEAHVKPPTVSKTPQILFAAPNGIIHLQPEDAPIPLITTPATDQFQPTGIRKSLVDKIGGIQEQATLKVPTFLHKTKIFPSKSEKAPSSSFSPGRETQRKSVTSRVSTFPRSGSLPRRSKAPRVSIFKRVPKPKPKPDVPSTKEFKRNEAKVTEAPNLTRSRKLNPKSRPFPRISIFDRVTKVAPKQEVIPIRTQPGKIQLKSNCSHSKSQSEAPRATFFTGTEKSKTNKEANPLKKPESLRVWVFNRAGELELNPEAKIFPKKPKASRLSAFRRVGVFRQKTEVTLPVKKHDDSRISVFNRAGKSRAQPGEGGNIMVAPAANPAQSRTLNSHLSNVTGVPAALTPAEM